mmetsp:Transcript_81166/g.173690  ORF Transcript_81166/g.173690 Transcript_81166/m.173690 type:complete len:100 (-) Transcript_81166:152-451(-)
MQTVAEEPAAEAVAEAVAEEEDVPADEHDHAQRCKAAIYSGPGALVAARCRASTARRAGIAGRDDTAERLPAHGRAIGGGRHEPVAIPQAYPPWLLYSF